MAAMRIETMGFANSRGPLTLPMPNTIHAGHTPWAVPATTYGSTPAASPMQPQPVRTGRSSKKVDFGALGLEEREHPKRRDTTPHPRSRRGQDVASEMGLTAADAAEVAEASGSAGSGLHVSASVPTLAPAVFASGRVVGAAPVVTYVAPSVVATTAVAAAPATTVVRQGPVGIVTATSPVTTFTGVTTVAAAPAAAVIAARTLPTVQLPAQPTTMVSPAPAAVPLTTTTTVRPNVVF